MITYIYPYRNREIERVKRSLDSLALQEDKDFNVIFVDYGSEFQLAKQVETLLHKYHFVNYIYTYSIGKPWNRAKALNIGIKHTETNYILSADIDMIFHPTFNGLLKSQAKEDTATFFKVGYLSKNETYNTIELIPESYSNHRAKGISLYPKSALVSISGFDEFFNCWGAEDEDLISRLILNNVKIDFYEQNTLVFHQYHKPFKELNHRLLGEELSYNQVRFHNDKKRKFNITQKSIIVNETGDWGKIILEEDYKKFVNTSISKTITSYKTEIDFFLYFELKHLNKGYWGFKFVQFIPDKNRNLKPLLYKLWTIRNRDLGAKEEYTLKEVNDLLLKYLIYENFDFHLFVDLKNDSLELRIHIK